MTDRLDEIRERLAEEGGSEELDVLISRWMGIDPDTPLWYTMEWTRDLDASLKFAAHLLKEVDNLTHDIGEALNTITLEVEARVKAEAEVERLEQKLHKWKKWGETA